jgi:hypothetical protein
MSACIVVGPTKVKPARRSAVDRARDSGDRVGTSSTVRGRGVFVGRNDQTSASSPPLRRSATVAAALVRAASIFLRFRTIPASASRRSTSSSVKAATSSATKPRNADRKAGLLFKMVSQDSPDWNASR